MEIEDPGQIDVDAFMQRDDIPADVKWRVEQIGYCFYESEEEHAKAYRRMRLQIFIECGGLDGEEHAELARKLKDEMANTRRLIASVKTLSPPAREKFNRLVEESQPEHDLLNEILKLRWDASISLAEVDEWNEATDAQQYELIRRKLFDLGMTDAEIEERIGVRKHRWENRSN